MRTLLWCSYGLFCWAMLVKIQCAGNLQEEHRYVRQLGMFVRGFRWCFTRIEPTPELARLNHGIFYKPGWRGSPWRFVLLVYWWDYGLASLLGCGCVSLSRFFELFGRRHHWGDTGPTLWGTWPMIWWGPSRTATP